jgi:hypothetical protein
MLLRLRRSVRSAPFPLPLIVASIVVLEIQNLLAVSVVRAPSRAALLKAAAKLRLLPKQVALNGARTVPQTKRCWRHQFLRYSGGRTGAIDSPVESKAPD